MTEAVNIAKLAAKVQSSAKPSQVDSQVNKENTHKVLSPVGTKCLSSSQFCLKQGEVRATLDKDLSNVLQRH